MIVHLVPVPVKVIKCYEMTKVMMLKTQLFSFLVTKL